jgi:hypothetical protein
MTQLYTQADTVENCKDAAKAQGYKYFALQNGDYRTKKGSCYASNDLERTTKYGRADDCKVMDTDTGTYAFGGDMSNYVDETNWVTPTSAPSVSPLLSQAALTPSDKLLRYLRLERTRIVGDAEINISELSAFDGPHKCVHLPKQMYTLA